jgi:hypothetical protein
VNSVDVTLRGASFAPLLGFQVQKNLRALRQKPRANFQGVGK